MTDADAEQFDNFVARHCGEESVYRMEDERKEKSRLASKLANAKDTVSTVTKRGRKPGLAT